jgi:hypothetical protein
MNEIRVHWFKGEKPLHLSDRQFDFFWFRCELFEQVVRNDHPLHFCQDPQLVTCVAIGLKSYQIPGKTLV